MSTTEENAKSDRARIVVGLGFDIVALFVVSALVTLGVIQFVHTSSPFSFGPTAYKISIAKPPTQPSPPDPPAPEACVAVSFRGLAVFFDNGSASLSECSKVALAKISKATSCDTAKVKVTPWVSSAPYDDDKDQAKNVVLARDRGEAVRKFLIAGNSKLQVDVRTWNKFGEIVSSLYYKDSRVSAKVEAGEEALNRRVDVEIVKYCRD